MMTPASRSCTYRRSGSLIASLADFGRRAEQAACPCAVVARYGEGAVYAPLSRMRLRAEFGPVPPRTLCLGRVKQRPHHHSA